LVRLNLKPVGSDSPQKQQTPTNMTFTFLHGIRIGKFRSTRSGAKGKRTWAEGPWGKERVGNSPSRSRVASPNKEGEEKGLHAKKNGFFPCQGLIRVGGSRGAARSDGGARTEEIEIARREKTLFIIGTPLPQSREGSGKERRGKELATQMYK